jgi:hypothetical protein
VNISAEPEHYGASANCPSCSQDLVVPTEPVTGSSEHQKVEDSSSVAKKLPRAKGKKMMMVGIPVVLVALIVGGVVAVKQAKPKPSLQLPAGNKEKTTKINTITIGGRIDDFVKKYEGADSVAVVSTERMNYSYKGFGMGGNAVLVIGYDDHNCVTCGVVFRHDGKKDFIALPLDEEEVQGGLKIFSRHEGLDWQETSVDGEPVRIWGYIGTDDSLKWGSSPMMAIYTPEIPYLIVFSTASDRASYKNLGEDMRRWKIYARNPSGSKNEKAGGRVTESPPVQAVQPKQETNRAGYNAYMTGYNDPEQGEVAEAMIDQFTGGDRQAALLMILGAEDKRKGLPIRFVVVAE